MEVNPNSRAVEVARTVDPSIVKPAPKAQTSPATFSDSEAVNRALQQSPDVRSDKVAQATQWANDVQYPPLATIRAIAHLLAINLDEGQE